MYFKLFSLFLAISYIYQSVFDYIQLKELIFFLRFAFELKLIYSEKVTKNPSSWFEFYSVNTKSSRRFCHIFVAFSE